MSNGYSTKYDLSLRQSVEIGMSVGAGVVFKMASMHMKITRSLSLSWKRSYSSTNTVDFTCTSFDAGSVSNGGCMWQLEVDIENVVEPAKSVNWTPLITRCTGGMKEPMCPPFTDCVDSECTLCS